MGFRLRKRKEVAVKGSIPVTIHNLGSPEGKALNFARKALYERMSPFLMDLAVDIPVYLVNEAQMDFLYPPERRRFFSEDRLRARLRALQEREGRDRENEEDPFAPMEDLDKESEDLWGRVKWIVAVGLYVRGELKRPSKERVLHLGEEKARTEEAEEAFLDHDGPAIFLCPERVVDWAKREGVPIFLLQDKIYYHELAHAFMDTAGSFPDPYGESWARVVEESLANLVAFNQFKGMEAARVSRLIQDQPPDYRGYAATSLKPFFLMEEYPRFFEFMEEYLYLFQKFIKYYKYYPHIPWSWPDFMHWFWRHGILFHFGQWNLLAWRETKRRGDWRHPEVRRAWRAFARFLLEEAVGA